MKLFELKPDCKHLFDSTETKHSMSRVRMSLEGWKEYFVSVAWIGDPSNLLRHWNISK